MNSHALPHFYYVFNQQEKYSTFTFSVWCNIEELKLSHIMGPMSIVPQRTTASLAILKDLQSKRNQKKNRLTKISPKN
jgi:hypothetical protein